MFILKEDIYTVACSSSQKKIITVCQTLQKNQYALWSLLDNEEYDEIMSRRLWKEISSMEDLLEFDF